MYLKEIPTKVLSCEYYEIFKNTYFEEHLWTAASVLLIIKLLIKYLTSANLFLIKNMTWNGLYYEGLQICSEYIFCWLLLETILTGLDIVLISGFWQIYAGCCPLHHVYFNDMQINRWQNFKDKGQLFTFNLWMTATKICRLSLIGTFFLFLWINLFCSIADV